jgi:hypothetical protein
MALPSVSLTFKDGGLGIITSGAGRMQVKVGLSTIGTPGVAQTCANPTTAKTLLGAGPLADAVIGHVGRSGAAVLAVNCVLGTAGSVGAFTQVGSGAGVVSASCAPHQQVLIKCFLGGALGTSTFQFSVNGAAYGPVVASVAGSTWAYRVPGTFTTLTFATGTYRTGDVYTLPVTGTVSASVPAGGPATITQVSSPLDAYKLQVKIALAGALATAQFTYSLDGGSVVSSPITTAASYVIPNTGIVLGFSAAAYVATDTYSATCSPPTFTSSAAQAAIEAAFADGTAFEGIHIVGTTDTSANAAVIATMLESEVQSAATTLLRYVWGVCECPTVEADATVKAALASFVSTTGRVSIAIGQCDLLSRDNALTMIRSIAWPYCTRLASTRMSEHPGKVMLGSLTGVSDIYPTFGGASCADTFDSARFVTARRITGMPGLYITRGQTMSLPTSDYSRIMNVRVANRAATIAQTAFTYFLNNDWRIDPDTGKLDARDAIVLEGQVLNQLRTALIGEPGSATDEVSSVSVALNPDNNMLSDSTLGAAISIVPKGYGEQINVGIGFVNPQITG